MSLMLLGAGGGEVGEKLFCTDVLWATSPLSNQSPWLTAAFVWKCGAGHGVVTPYSYSGWEKGLCTASALLSLPWSLPPSFPKFFFSQLAV